MNNMLKTILLANKIHIGFLLLLLISVSIYPAEAGSYKKSDPVATADVKNHLNVAGNNENVAHGGYASAGSSADASAVGQGGHAKSAATASNEGNQFTVNSSNQRSAPDVVLVPNNNTESCLRVIGLSFSNLNGGGGLGIPMRSAACDYDKAADAAAATGDHSLAWFYRCHKKSMQKRFGAPRWIFWTQHSDEAVGRCHVDAVSRFTAQGDTEQQIAELERRVSSLLIQLEGERGACDTRLGRATAACLQTK